VKKLLLVLGILMISCTNVFAAKIPSDVVNYINSRVSDVDFRFDGVIILPDNTIYLPIIPAKIIKPENLSVQTTVPANKTLADKPDVVIFNNDYTLLKVIEDDGERTVAKLDNPPHQIKAGLLPQDMLVPKGLMIPENMKSIIGNLEISTKHEPTLKIIPTKKGDNEVVNSLALIPQLKNKTIYATTTFTTSCIKLVMFTVKPVTYRDNYTIQGKLTDHEGNIITGAEVQLTINGETVTLTTDKKGRYTYKARALALGNFTVTATYNGEEPYNQVSVSKVLSVTKRATTLIIDEIQDTTVGTPTTITGKLTDENGTIYKNCNIYVKINGVHVIIFS